MRPSRGLLVLAALAVGTTWPAALALWFRVGERGFATSFFLLGLSLGPCLAIYALAPVARKQAARRLVLLTGGSSIMAFSILGAVNLDLEGFFMLVLTGTMGAAVGHTLVTVILGPLVFGRVLCGWGCWRAMVLELLPLGHRAGRRGGVWHWLPLAGLAASASGALLSLALGQHPGGTPDAVHAASLRALAFAFGTYYLASVSLGFALKDPRAFCKYLCPSSVILGLTSRLSLLQMTGDRRLCNACGACSRVCPMDIDVTELARHGQRVSSGQCILCQRCAHACPTGALHLGVGLLSRRA